MSRQRRVVLIGCGNRGQMFGGFCRDYADRVKLVALAEPREDYRVNEATRNNLPAQHAYASFEEALGPGAPAADLAIIAASDRAHHAAAVAALRRGMDLLTEKPVAHDPVLTVHLKLLAERLGRTVLVQHELRYSPFFQEVRRIVQSGQLGQVYSYTHTEHVEFWHMTHSFVRGPYGRQEDSNPMIVAKCCHDLDLIPWILDDRVTKVSSFGRLDHFVRAHKPDVAPDRCTDGCPLGDRCIHNAAAFYLGDRTGWPVAMVGTDMSLEGRRRRLHDGPLSRCVFNGENTVVDHQTVLMETRRGTLCTLTMQGFSAGEECGRKIRLDGTAGTLRGDMGRGRIDVYPHWTGPAGTRAEVQTLDLAAMGLDGHGGGDRRLFEAALDVFCDGADAALTLLADSVESHLIGWAAEQSRHSDRAVFMEPFRTDIQQQATAML
ncbi:MAG: Gfo/Idh/MocA family oxidoreductase [Planctomycetes bacterium]|nr:Gfo/Idh/MocA family oxidoreductase [Planctomycetota bacterium]